MDIVLFSFNPLQGRPGRAHHFASGLAQRHRVFFVDPPESFHRRPQLRLRVEQVHESLLHVRLPGGLGGRRTWAIHQLNQSRWLRGLRSALDKHRWGDAGRRVCLHMVPLWDRAAEVLRPDLTVYDAHDDWRTIAPNRPELITRLEARYARNADLILSVSDAIAGNFAELGRVTHDLPDAGDADLFARAITLQPADEIAALPRPRVLYVGGLDDCLAGDVVVDVARRMPDVSFVFVGPEIVRRRAMREQPNIFLLGERPYEQLPSYFAGADVCWIPFTLTPHGIGRDCIKLYEYLATGRPVVATPLPRAKEFAPDVIVAEATGTALADACRAALADTSDQARAKRLALAGRHTWTRRVEELEALLADILHPKRPQPATTAVTWAPAGLASLPNPPAETTGWPWTAETPAAPLPEGLSIEQLPTITLVTPTLNQGEFLEETIRSVLGQGYPRLQYIVVDGGSTDRTAEVLDAYGPFLTECIREGDQGESDAINKGLARGTGEVCGWLCSDDTLTPGALMTVGAHFARDPHCRWLAGAGDFVDLAAGDRTHCVAGLAGPMALLDYWRYGMAGHYIPQPSCFWRRGLWEAVGGVNVDNHLAMDFELWLAFQQRAELHTIDRTLSVSKLHAGAKSTRHRRQQYADMRRRALASASQRGIWPGVLVARKLWWTAAWRVGWLGRRILSRGKKRP